MGIEKRERTWRLIGPDGTRYASTTPGSLGGHRSSRIYGRLDCPAALRALSRGGYATKRVFFATEADAIAAGYRPCAVCLRDTYAMWKQGAVISCAGKESPTGGVFEFRGGIPDRRPNDSKRES